MSEIIQLYKDDKKTTKVYPKTIASEVYIDENTTILNSLQQKTEGFVNVSEKYCNNINCRIKGDGIHDDTSGFQLLLDNFSKIVVPPLIYALNNLKIKRGTQIIGMGSSYQWGGNGEIVTTFVNNGISDSDYIIINRSWETDGTPLSLSLENISFNGNGKNGVKGNDNISVKNCEFYKCKIGIENIRMGNVHSCVFSNNEKGILKLTDSRVSNSMFHNNSIALDMTGSNDNIISNNKIEWNETGLLLSSSVYNVINGNIFDANTNYGIKMADGNITHSITCNIFERNTPNQILIRGSALNIQNNSFYVKNNKDNQTGEEVPNIHINIESMTSSLITNNFFVKGKLFVNTSQFMSNNVIEKNIKEGIDVLKYKIAIPNTEIATGETAKISIPLNLEGFSGWDFEVESIYYKLSTSDFPRFKTYQSKLNTDSIVIDIKNEFTSTKTFTGYVNLVLKYPLKV